MIAAALSQIHVFQPAPAAAAAAAVVAAAAARARNEHPVTAASAGNSNAKRVVVGASSEASRAVGRKRQFVVLE